MRNLSRRLSPFQIQAHDNARRDAPLAVLFKHPVLFCEQQPITPLAQHALAARFGELHIHPV